MSETPEMNSDPAMAELSQAYTEAVRARIASLPSEIQRLQAELQRLTRILAALEGPSTQIGAYRPRETSIVGRIAALLTDGQVYSTQDIRDALQGSQSAVEQGLTRLTKQGGVRRVGHGRYQVTSLPSTETER